MLRVQNFLLGGHHESATALKLRGGRFNNWRVRMSMNKRCDIVGKVNARDAINVRDAATFPVRNIGRNRRPQHSVATDTTRHHFLGALKKLRAAAGGWSRGVVGGVGCLIHFLVH